MGHLLTICFWSHTVRPSTFGIKWLILSQFGWSSRKCDETFCNILNLWKMKLLEALVFAFEIKAQECSHETMLDYRSYITNFKTYWSIKEDFNSLLSDFSKRNALHYLDFLLMEKKHEAITRNNNLRGMKVLFNVLTVREYIPENPFVGIKPLKVKKKRRKQKRPSRRQRSSRR